MAAARKTPFQDAEVTPRVQFGHPVTGRKARKLSVAMAAPPERRRMLAAHPNATHIFSLANPRLLSFTACCASQSSPLLSVTPGAPSPSMLSRANLRSVAFCKRNKKKGRTGV